MCINISLALRFCYFYLTALSSAHNYDNCVLCFSSFRLHTPDERSQQLKCMLLSLSISVAECAVINGLHLLFG